MPNPRVSQTGTEDGSATSVAHEISSPLSIFGSLRPTDPEVTGLWPAEREVLEKYYSSLLNSHRVAIQLPTGSGKSMIGILIAEAWRRSGKQVAHLTSTRAPSDVMK